MAIIKMIKGPPKTKTSLKKLINYITQPGKTRPDLVGGLDCDWTRAYNDFIETKAEYGKEDGIQGKHMVMSFDVRDDVTVEMAKQIADEMLEHKMFDGFQVLYAVHKDREHIHTHFLINSVNMKTGKRWHQTAIDLQDLKIRSNELCRKYGLSEIELNQGKGAVSEIEHRRRFDNWKYELYLAALNSARRSSSIEDFKNLMNRLGYKVSWEDEKKYITFTTPNGKKCRNRKMYPRYKFTKEALEKQFEKNCKQYSAEKIKEFQEKLINKVNSQADEKYPFSAILENEENIESMSYREWYDKNREYLLDDDKYDLYKCIGYAMKYAVDEKDFISRLKRMGMNVEFDKEANISVFISKQGIEFGNYEFYQGEKYAPDKLKEIFDENKCKNEFNAAFWKCVKSTGNIKDFQDALFKEGYICISNPEEYHILNLSGKKMDVSKIDKRAKEILENKMLNYLNIFKWKSKNINEFFELLHKDGCDVNMFEDIPEFQIRGYSFTNSDFKIKSLKKYFEVRDDAQELRRIIGRVKMQALSKTDFIKKIEELGYEVKWCETIPYPENKDAGNAVAVFGKSPKIDKLASMSSIAYTGKILFKSPLGNEFDSRKLNTSSKLSGWFDTEELEKQFHKNVCRYLTRMRRQAKTVNEFIAMLRDEGHNVGIEEGDVKYNIEEEVFWDEQFSFKALNDYYDLANDKRELRNAIWQVKRYAVSKEDFIDKMEQLGYKVEWHNPPEYCANTNTKEDIVIFGKDKLSTAEDLLYNGKIEFTTLFGNKFDNIVDLKPPEIFSNAALEKAFAENRNHISNYEFNNNFNILSNFLHIFTSNDSAPITSSMSLVGNDLTGEKLREFMYHFEKGTASLYNKNLENDFSM